MGGCGSRSHGQGGVDHGCLTQLRTGGLTVNSVSSVISAGLLAHLECLADAVVGGPIRVVGLNPAASETDPLQNMAEGIAAATGCTTAETVAQDAQEPAEPAAHRRGGGGLRGLSRLGAGGDGDRYLPVEIDDGGKRGLA